MTGTAGEQGEGLICCRGGTPSRAGRWDAPTLAPATPGGARVPRWGGLLVSPRDEGSHQRLEPEREGSGIGGGRHACPPDLPAAPPPVTCRAAVSAAGGAAGPGRQLWPLLPHVGRQPPRTAQLRNRVGALHGTWGWQRGLKASGFLPAPVPQQAKTPRCASRVAASPECPQPPLRTGTVRPRALRPESRNQPSASQPTAGSRTFAAGQFVTARRWRRLPAAPCSPSDGSAGTGRPVAPLESSPQFPFFHRLS